MAGAAAVAALESGKFREILWALRLRAIQTDLPKLNLQAEIPDVSWHFALLCASALTSEPSEASQIAVLRVASGCLQDQGARPEERLAATALLERDGNGLAVRLAEKQGLFDRSASASLPIAIELEVINSKLKHSIPLSTGENLAVNGFQIELWLDAKANDWLSVSAPTSSGKSRILREWFLEQLRVHDDFSAAYIVPTRALVEEVAASFRATVEKETSVFMMPWDQSIHETGNRVLVMTQERLHLVQVARPDFHVDLLFIDEAQGLGSAHRGILLQQVIDRTVAANPATQVLFASPMSQNPELLLGDKPVFARGSAFASETVTVNQNLFRIEHIPGTRSERSVALIHGGDAVPIGTVSLPSRPSGVYKTIAAIAQSLGSRGGNIIYANTPNDAEKISVELCSLIGETSAALDPEIIELQSLIATAVHPDYALIKALNYGVAFHYGNMPLAVRAEIERLFEEDRIAYLVCTSTLLEGVNLPCRNIFIRAPRKGQGNPMSELDFWNLAGRAGRWGKEFQGNVICIDTNKPGAWTHIPAVRGRFMLRRAVPSGLSDPTGLLEYLETAETSVDANADGEGLFSYLAARFVSGSSLEHELASIEDESVRKYVYARIELAVNEFEPPASLIPKHAGISPIAMMRLLKNFQESGLPAKALLIPKPATAVKERYKNVYARLGATMTTAFGHSPQTGEDKRKWQIAGLVINWMNGMPLAPLIEQRKTEKYPLPRAIRDVMSDIETVVRFQSAKYLACYNDVLATYAAQQGATDAVPTFDVTMMLELGVARPSQVALMSAGLSRTATIAISHLIVTEDWTTQEALVWLRATNFSAVEIPAALKKEIENLARKD
ncbi:DEAD/DEAH box helicase [Pseudarthrobacter sp. B4EP4b]|uniref:DEAD/DEAH box helicase n=1 Tax=Pseudarthrobacter sp. B4EP4b TaxID=2590664 RepID=UPI0015EE92FE|nr:DEAD/DEAH box helicase [Pseudarthrobacter sp. B4EP4b]